MARPKGFRLKLTVLRGTSVFARPGAKVTQPRWGWGKPCTPLPRVVPPMLVDTIPLGFSIPGGCSACRQCWCLLSPLLPVFPAQTIRRAVQPVVRGANQSAKLVRRFHPDPDAQSAQPAAGFHRQSLGRPGEFRWELGQPVQTIVLRQPGPIAHHLSAAQARGKISARRRAHRPHERRAGAAGCQPPARPRDDGGAFSPALGGRKPIPFANDACSRAARPPANSSAKL
jgi:hypothetical protein